MDHVHRLRESLRETGEPRPAADAGVALPSGTDARRYGLLVATAVAVAAAVSITRRTVRRADEDPLFQPL